MFEVHKYLSNMGITGAQPMEAIAPPEASEVNNNQHPPIMNSLNMHAVCCMLLLHASVYKYGSMCFATECNCVQNFAAVLKCNHFT